MVFYLTWLISQKCSRGFFQEGRGLVFPVIAGSIFSFEMIGLNGAAFKDGLSVIAWVLLAIIGLVLMALYFLPRFLKNGISTLPEFLEVRFDLQTRLLTDLILLVAYATILLPTILYSAVIGLMEILNLHLITGIQSDTVILWPGVWILGILGTFYAFYGGQKFFAISATLNGIGLLVGGLLITYFGLQLVGEGKGIYEGWLLLKIYSPEKFDLIGNSNQLAPFGTLFSGVLLLNLFYWGTGQQFIQSTISAKDLAEGQKSVLFTGALKLLGPLYLIVPGLIAFHFFGDKKIFPDKAFGLLVYKVLPPYFGGFFAAVLVGAILNCYSSALNSLCTLYRLGFYRNIINPNSSGEQALNSSKSFGWVIATISMSLAPFLMHQKSVFFYLQKMNGIFLIPLFAVIVMGAQFKQIPPLAAKLALFLGVGVISFGYFLPIKESFTFTHFIHEFYFLGLVFILLVGVMFIVGWINPMKKVLSEEDIKPIGLRAWKYAVFASITLILLIFGIYYSFSDFSLEKFQLESGSVLLVVIFLVIFKGVKIFYQRTDP